MPTPPLAVSCLVAAGLALDAVSVLLDPGGDLPLAWGVGGLLLAAAFLWPRQPHQHETPGPGQHRSEPVR